MRDIRKPHDDERRRGREPDDERDTWYEECAQRPMDDPLITTIPLPDEK